MSLLFLYCYFNPLKIFLNQNTLNTSVDYLSTQNISLILQTLILLGLALGYLYMKQKKITNHSYIMLIIYSIHVLSVLIYMWTPALNILRNIPLTNLGYSTVFHVALGIIVLILSTYVILEWRFQKPAARCYKMKKTMKILTILWVTEALFGTLMYYIIYLQ